MSNVSEIKNPLNSSEGTNHFIGEKPSRQKLGLKVCILNTFRVLSRVFSIESEFRKIHSPVFSRNFLQIKAGLDNTLFVVDYIEGMKASINSLKKARKNHQKHQLQHTNSDLAHQKHRHCQGKIADFVVEIVYNTCQFSLSIMGRSDYLKKYSQTFLICGNVLSLGLTSFQVLRLQIKKRHYSKLLENKKISLVESNKAQFKLLHLTTKIKLQRSEVFDNLVMNVANLAKNIFASMPLFNSTQNMKNLNDCIVVLTEIINVKNFCRNFLKLISTRNEVKSNAIKTIKALKPIYEYRTFSLENKINQEIVMNIVRNAINFLQWATTTATSIVVIAGVSHFIFPLAVTSFSLFVINQGVEILNLFKQVKIHDHLHTQAKKAIKDNIDKPLINDLKIKVASDFGLVDDDGKVHSDLIHVKHINKWLNA